MPNLYYWSNTKILFKSSEDKNRYLSKTLKLLGTKNITSKGSEKERQTQSWQREVHWCVKMETKILCGLSPFGCPLHCLFDTKICYFHLIISCDHKVDKINKQRDTHFLAQCGDKSQRHADNILSLGSHKNELNFSHFPIKVKF